MDAVCEMMQFLWGDGESRRDEILDSYQWDEEPSVTRVNIVPNGKLDIKNSDIDLKLVVDAGGTKFSNTSMQSSYRTETSDGKLHSYLATSPVQVQCVSRNDVFSHMVSAECAHRLQDNAIVIKNRYAFHEFVVKGHGPPQEVGEGKSGIYVSPVKIEIRVEHSTLVPGS